MRGVGPRFGDDEIDPAVAREDGHRRHDLELERGGDQRRHGRRPRPEEPVVVAGAVADPSPAGRRRVPERERSRSRRALPGGSGPPAAPEFPRCRPEGQRPDPAPDGAPGAAPPARRAGARGRDRSPAPPGGRGACRARCRTRRTRARRAPAGRRRGRSPAPARPPTRRARTAGSTVSRRARISRRSAALAATA